MNRLLLSTPLRVALLLGAAFLVALVVANLAAFQLIERELDLRADRAISDTFKVISGAYGDTDQTDLIESVRAHAASTLDHDKLFALTDESGKLVAGNVASIPPTSGWATVGAGALGLPSSGGEDYRIFVGDVGTGRLLVGSSFAETRDIAGLTRGTLVWASVSILVIVVLIGIALALRAQRRIDGIASTMTRVGHGELTARIPVGRRGDDIDMLSRQVNAALDRLAALVEGMRQVSVNIAHDLKTPLNRLAITIEAATDAEARGVPVTEHLAQAEMEMKRINSTFDALLRIAQIEAGARRARFVRLQLAEVLDKIADAYADVADEAGQTLQTSYPPSLPEIVGDPELLTQLCANLVENSIRHCPAGTTIGVGAAVDGTQVVATFSDDGPGIPASEHEKVFQRLYRLEKSRTTSGNGLGLSLVKAVAELHGAVIAIADRSPGLAISVRFPAAGTRD
jgi:signal transduction histidine kinase